MHIICNPTELLKAVAVANKAIPTNPAHLQLLNVIIKAEPEVLKIEAFNGQMALSWVVKDATVNTPGEVAVLCKDLRDFLDKLKKEEAITLSTRDDYLYIKGNRAKEAKLAKANLEEIPWIDPLIAEETEQFSMEADDLARGIEETKYAASTEMSKAILCGVCFNFAIEEEYILEMAATDGHRLAKTRLFFDPLEERPDSKLVIPIEALTLTSFALKQMERNEEVAEMVTISYDQNKIQLDFSDGYLRGRKIDGDYPNYEALIIADDFYLNCTLDRKRFLEALKFIETFAVGKDCLCFLDFNPEEKKCTVRSTEEVTGSAEDTIEVEEIEGQEHTLGFNSKYLKDCLRAMPGDTITLKVTETAGDMNGPVFIASEAEYNTFGLIMPIRIVGD